VNNGSQLLLDLQQGSGITLTDNGSGQITIATGGAGGDAGHLFYGGQSINPGITQGVFSAALHSQDGLLGVARVNIPFSISVIEILTNINDQANNPGQYLLAGIYSQDGDTLLVDCGFGFVLDGSFPLGPRIITLASPVSLAAGDYLFVWGTAEKGFGVISTPLVRGTFLAF
jgi:hypothetical protein